jgi:radical SAM superfamily enzyme YgiQ (UPF0313 family)
MKKVGIITLTRRMTLAYSVLKKIVRSLGYRAVCGEAIESDGLFFPIEELSVVGDDFLFGFFKKAEFENLDAILISAPYTVNLFHLPKLIGCLRRLTPAPIIVGGNEMSNNFKNIMTYNHRVFVNDVIDISPDFIVRGAAENVLYSLLPLVDQTTRTKNWDQAFLQKLLDIPNLVFWLPDREALYSTRFSSKPLSEKDIFAHVKYGEKSIAITLQRACVWTKKSGGGCLFCAIASQFGKDFHCATEQDAYVQELAEILRKDPAIQYIDIWDDTFNIDERWVLKTCENLQKLTRTVDREIVYSCFLRPKGLNEALTRKMGETRFKVAFVGADALTEDLSKRMRRGCSIAELNRSIEMLGKGGIQPRLSVQLFSPESTIDDVGITATVVLGCIQNGESTAHVHLYTFPLFGSDIYKLLEARGNLKKIPSPLLKQNPSGGFDPYLIAYDFNSYDPDVEEIKRDTFKMLDLTASFFVKTYPGDHIDGAKLKSIVTRVRDRSIQVKKTHPVKSMWFLIVLLLEEKETGVDKQTWIDLLSKQERIDDIPAVLRRMYGNFGYRFTLSRSFDQVVDILAQQGWVRRTEQQMYRMRRNGLKKLRSMLLETGKPTFHVAAYAVVEKGDLLNILDRRLKQH